MFLIETDGEKEIVFNNSINANIIQDKVIVLIVLNDNNFLAWEIAFQDIYLFSFKQIVFVCTYLLFICLK